MSPLYKVRCNRKDLLNIYHIMPRKNNTALCIFKVPVCFAFKGNEPYKNVSVTHNAWRCLCKIFSADAFPPGWINIAATVRRNISRFSQLEWTYYTNLPICADRNQIIMWCALEFFLFLKWDSLSSENSHNSCYEESLQNLT